MTDMHRRSGSVILLVVGLLTILAMLGSVLLISSHLDAKQSRALAQQAPTDSIAAGIIKQIQTILKRDLHLTGVIPGSPYDNARVLNTPPWPTTLVPPVPNWDDPRRWKAYIDMPAARYNNGPLPVPLDLEYDIVDPWLTDSWLASDDLTETGTSTDQWTYSYLSDITGELLPEQCRRPRFIPAPSGDYNDPWTLETDPTRSGVYAPDPDNRRPVDTDGDKVPDAILIDSGVTNADGQKYYFAARVTDLSGKLSVNTAGVGGASVPTSPMDVELDLYLDPTASGEPFNTIHDLRSGGDGTGPGVPLSQYYTEAGIVLLAPDTITSGVNYRPFAIGEEMNFRWLAPTTVAENTRLGKALVRTDFTQNILEPQENRLRALTTFNCSRALMRDPTAATSAQFDFSSQLDVLTSDTTRRAAYNTVLDLINTLGIIGGVNEEMAAHFVANLWAYQTGNLTDPHAFSPAGEAFTVYGLQAPTLRITEAFATHTPNTSGDDYYYAYAIEVMNVSDQNVDLDDYQIAQDGGRAFPLPSITLTTTAPNNKAVLYSTGAGASCLIAEADRFSDNTDPATMTKWRNNNDQAPARDLPIDFSNNGVVGIYRTAGSTLIPIDKVSYLDLNTLTTYTCSDKTNPPASVVENIRRDDVLSRARYNVADYKELSNPPPVPSVPFTLDHELGKQNSEVADIDNIGSDFTVPIFASGMPIQDIAELADIYFTGPIDLTGSGRFQKMEPFTTRIVPFTSTDPSMGRISMRPSTIVPVTDYPEVPTGALLGELITLLQSDNARTYGRININSATREVLRQLPWPTGIDHDGDVLTADIAITTAEIDAAIDYIFAYRDRLNITPGNGNATFDPDYRSLLAVPPGPGRGDGTVAALNPALITGLRGTSDYDGFLTPGEVAIPLGDYVINNLMLIPGPDTPELNKYYQSIRDSFYTPISNLVTVNSDTYAVNIRVDLYDADESPEDIANYDPQHTWYYIAVIDRSNCYNDRQTPAVLLFSEVK